MASAQSWWSQPLPAGWEAKYDANQRRYFFIDHRTKKTSWEDPRQTLWNQQQQQHNHHTGAYSQQHGHSPYQASPATAHGHHLGTRDSPAPGPSPRQNHTQIQVPQGTPGRHSPSQRSHWQQQVEDKFGMKVNYMANDEEESSETSSGPAADEEKLSKLTSMFPSADRDVIKKILSKRNNVEGMVVMDLTQAGYKRFDAPAASAQMKNEIIIGKLKHDFPGVDEALLQDILRGVSFSEYKARQELKQLGYRSLDVSSSSSPRTSQSSQRPVSPSRHASPAASTATPPQSTISELAKSQMKEKLQREFPDVQSSTIEMALDVCNYDETRTRTLVSRNRLDTPSRPTDRSKSPSRIEEGERSGSPARTSSPRGATTTRTDTHHTASATASHSSRVAVSSSLPRGSADRSSPHRTTTPSSRRQTTVPKTTHQGRSQHRTATSSTVASRGSATYVSANKTKAAGPNKDLAKGPDASILITDYIENKGANRQLRKGPDPNNFAGPSCSISHNSGLSNGPSRMNRSGPNRAILVGPMHAATYL